MTPEDDEFHIHRTLDGLLVFDTRRNRIHHLNASGAAIFEHARSRPDAGIDAAPAGRGILAPARVLEQFLDTLAREELIAVKDDEERRDVRGWTVAEEADDAGRRANLRFGKPLINSYTITDRKKEPDHTPAYLPDSDLATDDIHLDDFLHFHGSEFVTVAYQWILGRDPDPDGYNHYLGRLESGEATRERILRDIRNSEEGRLCNVHVDGL